MRCLGLIIAALVGIVACGAAAHEIPSDVRINAFVRPAGDRLELLVRVPLQAMQDVDVPLRAGGYLDLGRADEALRDAAKLWLIDNIDVYENDARLPEPRLVAARASLPSDRSFVSYEQARAAMQGPRLREDLDLYWDQLLLDVRLEYPIKSERSEFAIRLRVDRLAMRVTTALRFLLPGGAVRAFEFEGDPGVVRLDPRLSQAALRFMVAGFWHILDGLDHLLFLVCLVIPFRRLRPLIAIVTAFTVAHSLSLIAATFGFTPSGRWFPPLIETLIAVTIVTMALENIVYMARRTAGSGPAGAPGGAIASRRWMMAFAFGLIHGFGFSFALRETLQFAGDHLLVSLLGFNIGVEIGQIAVVLVLVPALGLLFRYVVPERVGIIILSALVAHTAWHWMLERGEQLTKFPLPTIDAALLAGALRALMAALILAGVVWLANGVVKRWLREKDVSPAGGFPGPSPGQPS